MKLDGISVYSLRGSWGFAWQVYARTCRENVWFGTVRVFSSFEEARKALPDIWRETLERSRRAI